MARSDARSRPTALHVLDEHYVYLSDADEAQIFQRDLETGDVAELALRTCRCGARIDGFDAYFEHLREMLSRES